MSKRTLFILSFSFPFFLGVVALWVFITSDLARQKRILGQEAVARLQTRTDLFASEFAFHLLSKKQTLDLVDKVPIAARATNLASEGAEGFMILSTNGQPIWQSSPNLPQFNDAHKNALINASGQPIEIRDETGSRLLAVSKKVKDYPLEVYAVAPPITPAMNEEFASIRARWLGFGAAISLLLVASLYWFFLFRYSAERAEEKRLRDLELLSNSQNELSASRQMLRDLAAHQIHLKEEERKRIALEIHDELGQRLTALRLEVALMEQRFVQYGGSLTLQSFNNLKGQIDETLKIVRNVATRLRPATLDIGLSSAIMGHLEDFRDKTGLDLEFANELPDNFSLTEAQITGIFRILQEALTNIARHSEATRVEITLTNDEQNVSMIITDNGRGFDSTAGSGRYSLGISGMKERAASLGGFCEIESVLGQGTQMRVVIPLVQPEFEGFAAAPRYDPLSLLRSE
jgi:signal transduction histidine kinase